MTGAPVAIIVIVVLASLAGCAGPTTDNSSSPARPVGPGDDSDPEQPTSVPSHSKTVEIGLPLGLSEVRLRPEGPRVMAGVRWEPDEPALLPEPAFWVVGKFSPQPLLSSCGPPPADVVIRGPSRSVEWVGSPEIPARETVWLFYAAAPGVARIVFETGGEPVATKATAIPVERPLVIQHATFSEGPGPEFVLQFNETITGLTFSSRIAIASFSMDLDEPALNPTEIWHNVGVVTGDSCRNRQYSLSDPPDNVDPRLFLPVSTAANWAEGVTWSGGFRAAGAA